MTSLYRLPGSAWPNLDLVGEFYRRDEIVRLFGGMPKNSEPLKADFDVMLVAEPDNPHSPAGNAVSARVEDIVIGYLSEENARKYSVLQRISASGAVATTAANVFAYQASKWRDGRMRREVEVNVRIALPEPNMITPLNAEPICNTAVLPWGRAFQVVGEDQHFDHLFEYIPDSGTGLVVLTMHILPTLLKNGRTKEIVELRLDRERVGQLTPATSQHYIPTILHAKDMGKTLGVWSVIQGSGLAAELVIHGLRAPELTDDWLNEMPEIPTLVPEAAEYDVPPAYQRPGRSKRSLRDRKSPWSIPVKPAEHRTSPVGFSQPEPLETTDMESQTLPQADLDVTPVPTTDTQVLAERPENQLADDHKGSDGIVDGSAPGLQTPESNTASVPAAPGWASQKLVDTEAKRAEAALLREQRLLAKQEAKAAAAPVKQERRAAQTRSVVKAGKTTATVALKAIGWAVVVFALLFIIAAISLWADGDSTAGIGGLIMGLIAGAIGYFLLRASKRTK